jgi:hypothetical protein
MFPSPSDARLRIGNSPRMGALLSFVVGVAFSENTFKKKEERLMARPLHKL